MDVAENNNILISPVGKLDTSDPGDATFRKYRYQHAYGVILLVNMLSKGTDYRAIWCEQNEDFLTEIDDTHFDAYQVKTKDPSTGRWEINDESFYSSIKKFVEVYQKFPDFLRNYYFVSDTDYSSSSSKSRTIFSPYKLLDDIRSSPSLSKITDLSRFERLNDYIKVDKESLFHILKRLFLVLGPTERAFEDELSQTHISKLSICSELNALELARVRSLLVNMVSEASSLSVSDPGKHLIETLAADGKSPLLLAKRLSKEDVALFLKEIVDAKTFFSADLFSMHLPFLEKQGDVLFKKMARGGLSYHYEIMRRRAICAERELLEIATRPQNGLEHCSQIENTVLGICNDAHLRASQADGLYGPQMLIKVQDKCTEMIENSPSIVLNKTYDCLLGVAGLLTSDCQVWWSDKFDLESRS